MSFLWMSDYRAFLVVYNSLLTSSITDSASSTRQVVSTLCSSSQNKKLSTLVEVRPSQQFTYYAAKVSTIVDLAGTYFTGTTLDFDHKV
jgi:hypothetical protein